jgi:hypothetical protein
MQSRCRTWVTSSRSTPFAIPGKAVHHVDRAHATFCEGWKAFELARYLLRIEPLRPDVCIPWHSSDPSLICLKQADAPFVTDCGYALPITQVAHFHLTQFLVDPCPNVFTGVQYAFVGTCPCDESISIRK